MLYGTPPADNAGPVTIPVMVSDGKGGQFAASVTIHPANPGPDAVNGSSATAYATPVVLNLLANDWDSDGDALRVVSATVPASQGTVSLVNGTWVFTPKAGFTGAATVTYTIEDQDGATDMATHLIVVAKPVVVAKDDAYTVRFNTPLNGNAATGDTYPAGSKFAAVTPPAHGSVVMAANGTYRYVPTKGFYGTDTFTYKITDPTGKVVTARQIIKIAPPPHTCLVTFGKLKRH